MKWFKQNAYIASFIAIASALIIYMAVTDEKIEKYEQIVIQYGDTLWSLADEYRGKMAKEDWVLFVQRENDLFHEPLYVGQVIYVPIERDSSYIAKLSEQSNTANDSNSIKVASDDR